MQKSQNCTNRKIVIALVISELGLGGAERQVVEIANQLDRAKFDVHVVSLSDHVPLRHNLKVPDANFHVLRKNMKYDLSIPFRLARLFNRIDCTICHAFLFGAEVATSVAAFLAGTPVRIMSERNADYKLGPVKTVAKRISLRSADFCIANSRRGAIFNRDLFGQPSTEYKVVYNGVNVREFFPQGRGRMRATLGLGPDKFVVGMVANFKEQKNHQMALEVLGDVAKQRKDVVFVFVGEERYVDFGRADSYAQEMLQKFDIYVEAGRCKFVGKLTNVSDFYSACDVTILTSNHEGFPNVVLESMACGTPVVVTDVSDNRFLVRQGVDGFVVPINDYGQMAKKLIDLYDQPFLVESLARNARERVTKRFSSELMSSKLAEIYTQAARQLDCMS